jgi:hypothetical protein
MAKSMCGVSLDVVEQIKGHLAEVLGQEGVHARLVVTDESFSHEWGRATGGHRDYVLAVTIPPDPEPSRPYTPSADDPVFLEAVRAAVAKIAEKPAEVDDEDDCERCNGSGCVSCGFYDDDYSGPE